MWSPCSSVVSYSPPPLSDLEDDGIPPSPPQSSPSSPDASTTSLMAPNDATLKSPTTTTSSTPNAHQRLRGTPPLSESLHDGHKDRPPDGTAARSRRTHISSSSSTSPRKRTGGEGATESDRRSKTSRSSSYLNVTPVVPLESDFQVTTQPELLARLSGLTNERLNPKFGRSNLSPRIKGEKISKNNRVNGIIRRSLAAQDKLKDHVLNNNISSRHNNNLSNEKRNNCSSVCEESNSSSSSTSTSGTSTPTSTKSKVRFPASEKKDANDICKWHNCGAMLDQSSSLLEHIQVGLILHFYLIL